MRILRHPDEVLTFSRCASSPPPPWMEELICQRLAELTAEGDPMEELVLFVIADSDTTLADIESVLGHPVLTEDAHPLWEVLERHAHGWEWVFVLHDSGYGAIVLVPDSPDTDLAVLNLCRAHSTAHAVDDAHAMTSREGDWS